jgi:cellulose biosynthesis protein BcsQ
VRSLALHNLKGGVGKTTAAVNLAFLSSKCGLRTMLWDLDPQGASSMYLNVGPGLPGGAEKMLRGDELAQAIKRTSYARLDVLPADLSLRLLDIELDHVKKPKKRIARIMEELGARYDVMILDAPPGLGLLSEAILRAVDLLLVPVIPSPLGIYVYERMSAHLRQEGYDLRRVPAFFSMVDRRRRGHREIVETYAGRREPYLSCTIPYAAEIEKMGVHRAPLGVGPKETAASRAYAALWGETSARLGFRPVVRPAAPPPEQAQLAQPAP